MPPEAVLPPLRQELELIAGPTGANGSPGWLLHDPVRNQYFQIDWVSVELLRAWGPMPPQALLAALQAQGRVAAGTADLDALLQFLSHHQLLQPAPGLAAQWAQSRRRMAGHWWAWLLHNYLFFRIPLLRPDAFLGRALPAVRPLFTRGFAVLTVLAGLWGLVGVSREWDRYARTLVDFFSWQGVLAYALTLAVVKVLHEFGHAFTAKRYGCQVPTMGLAFLVLWPVLYTDTNDVWRLPGRRQRLAVSSAGIVTEGLLAVWATFFWLFAPDGHARDMLFLVSSTTWVSTLLINASPFMRFDGYFIVMDALGFPNLHARAFALARWQLRRRVLGLADAPPETFAPRQRALLIAFAWATWAYRLFLFLGIAVLVYHFFVKLVGIFLFLVEIVWFVAKPLASELAVWRERWGELPPARRGGLALAGIGLLAALLWLPVPGRVVASAVLMPAQWHGLYAPGRGSGNSLGARLSRAAPEAAVRGGAPLFEFTAPQLESQQLANEARQAAAQWQSDVAAMSPDTRAQWDALAAQSGVASAEGQAIRSDLGDYRLTAPFDGRLQRLDPDLRPGQWLPPGEPLGRVVGATGGLRVLAYVQDVELQRLRRGQHARFVADSGTGPGLDLVIDKIHTDRAQTLTEPELAAPAGGSVPVREQHGQLFPEGAFYRVELLARDAAPGEQPWQQFRWRGHVYMAAEPEPLLAPALRSAASVLVREFGF